MIKTKAIFSDCGRYRFLLSKEWGNLPPLIFIMLNPSTATEMKNDPTVERCEQRARRMGFGGVTILNLFALRSTDPRQLYLQPDPIGRAFNDALILENTQEGTIICGWGTHGNHLGRGETVRWMLFDRGRTLHHLGLNRDGTPKHPLYRGYDINPQEWR